MYLCIFDLIFTPPVLWVDLLLQGQAHSRSENEKFWWAKLWYGGRIRPHHRSFIFFLHFSAFFGIKILRDAFSIADHTIRALTWYIIVSSLWFSCRNGIGFFQIIFKSESGPIRMNLIRNRSESEQKSMNPIQSDPKSDRIRISDRTAHLYRRDVLF